MKTKDIIIKRTFDVVFSVIGLIVLGIFMIVLQIIAFLDTKQSGIFKQKRVGQYGSLFNIYKLRTMKEEPDGSKSVTKIGWFLRNTKLDELPQLMNVLKGDMSFVGPRPDVEGYADKLEGENRVILSVKPGITGLATLYFKDEEQLLTKQRDSQDYNNRVIWPKKVELNKKYIREYSFYNDLKIIFKTIF